MLAKHAFEIMVFYNHFVVETGQYSGEIFPVALVYFLLHCGVEILFRAV